MLGKSALLGDHTAIKDRNLLSGLAVLLVSIGLITMSSGVARAVGLVQEWSYMVNSAFDYNNQHGTNLGTTDTVPLPCPACFVFETPNTGNTVWNNDPASIYWGRTPGVVDENASGLTVGKTDVTGTAPSGNSVFALPGVHTANGGNGPGSFVAGDNGVLGAASADTAAKLQTQFLGNPTNFTTTVNFTHHNHPVPTAAHDLRTTALLAQLLLHDGTSLLAPLSLIFPITFVETPNTGTPEENRDLFVLDNPIGEGVPDLEGDTFSQQFNHMDQDYLIQIKLNGLAPLTPDQCEIVLGAGMTTCSGLVTFENTTNSFQTELAITAVPIPQAGILFFSALAGLGLVARRKKVKAQA